jgi:plasmid stabilization system protein ParE
MQIELHEDSLEDLKTAYWFYENQQVGLGDYFLDTVYSEIDSLVLYAGIHRKVFGSHRLLIRKFPFGVYYDVRGEIVDVWSVLDCRKAPGWIKARIQGSRRKR